jgi:hypothetical protein
MDKYRMADSLGGITFCPLPIISPPRPLRTLRWKIFQKTRRPRRSAWVSVSVDSVHFAARRNVPVVALITPIPFRSVSVLP